jgi:AcrR family transcriptional regulator
VPKLKPEEVEQRRREILDAARRCFLRRGFHRATTDEICREAAITPGGLYHYFKHKEDLIQAVVQDSADQAVREVRSTAQASPGPRTALQRLGALLAQTVQSPEFYDNARLDLEIWSESMRREELSQILATGRAAVHEALAEIIHDAVTTGEYSDMVDPDALAALLMGVHTGLQINKLLAPRSTDPPSAMNALAVLIRGELLASNAASQRRRL